MERATAAFTAAGLLGQGAAAQEHARISGRFDAVLHRAAHAAADSRPNHRGWA